ncbi:MAG: phosphatidate cytidylyltransferase [Planctomycetes bacterium]|nr:phosphatidate cytidylyltransferase [Planctomycetota bacterium]
MSTHHRDRYIYGTLLLVGVLLILWLDVAVEATYGFLGLSTLFGVVSWIEFRRMAGSRIGLFTWLGSAVLAAALIGEWWFCADPSRDGRLGFWTGFAVAMPLLSVLCSLRSTPSRQRAVEIAVAALGVVYLAVPLMLFLRLRHVDGGQWWVMLAVLVVKSNDIGGYLTGRRFGRTPLSAISPKKTVEGAVGGLLLGIGTSIGVYALLLSGDGSLPIGRLAALGALTGIAGQTGDLAESFFKRAFGVKDSGALVPAFGGTLDMIDSVLFGAPMVYLAKTALEL